MQPVGLWQTSLHVHGLPEGVKTIGHDFKTSHYRQSPQRCILDWALVALEPHITTLKIWDSLNTVRATYVYTRLLRANKSQLPQLPHVGSDFYICRLPRPPPSKKKKAQKELADTLDLTPLVFKCGKKNFLGCWKCEWDRRGEIRRVARGSNQWMKYCKYWLWCVWAEQIGLNVPPGTPGSILYLFFKRGVLENRWVGAGDLKDETRG